MNTQELAKTFTDMCAKGEFDAAGKKFWSDDIVSREPMTGEMAVLKGRKAIEGKGQWWYANHEVHNVKVEGPYVHGDQFVVRFKMEVTPKGKQRMNLSAWGNIAAKITDQSAHPATSRVLDPLQCPVLGLGEGDETTRFH